MSEVIDRQNRQARLIKGLLNASAYPHPAEQVRHIETHISHILLAGEFAYKVKKPLDLGFLDYQELTQRRHYCEEELRLNSRTAPEIYLDVVGVGGHLDAPRIVPAETSGCMEYAVHMRRFPAGALLSERLQAGALDSGLIDTLAGEIAAFHQSAAAAGPDTPWGAPDQVRKPVQDNFDALSGQSDPDRLQGLSDWAEQTFTQLHGIFGQRREAGRVRECHGDLHLGNIVMWEGQPRLFDGIEFNEGLRWIDVINDVAFLMMDLQEKGCGGQAWQLINRYLEFTGDYLGVAVLDYYRAYRAMVRAKVAAIRLHQNDLDPTTRQEVGAALEAYLALAASYTCPARPYLLLTSGLSGSGKTWVAQKLLQSLGLISLRSDVERKRLFGLGPLAHSDSAQDAGIYTPEASRRTYARLQEQADMILGTGHPAIVDATFLGQIRRQTFIELAQARRMPVLIIRCEADEATLRRRIIQRQSGGRDASEAGLSVLQQQLDRWERVAEHEDPVTLVVDTGGEIDIDSLARRIRRRVGAQG